MTVTQEIALDDDSLLDKIDTLTNAGQYAQALQLANQKIADAPDAAIGQHLMAFALLRIGRAQDALGYARQARQLENDNPVYQNHLALTLRQLNQHKEATKISMLLVEDYPNYADAWNNLGLGLSNQNQFKDAELAFENAIAADEHYAEAWNNLGSLRYKQERFEEALSCFDHAVSLNEDYVEAWLNRGELLMKRVDMKSEALNCFTKAVEIRPDHMEAWYKLCHYLVACERYQQAMDVGVQILEVNPDHIGTLLNLAAASDRLGEHQRATIFLRHILILNPNHSQALVALAHKALILGAPLEALAMTQNALKFAPHEGAIYHLLGQIYVKMRRLQDAMTAFGTANRLSPNNPFVQQAIGEVLLLNGQYKEGLRALQARYQTGTVKKAYDAPELEGRLWKNHSQTQGARLLIVAEGNWQNDLINLRYLNLIRQQCPNLEQIKLVCDPEFAHYIQNHFDVDHIYMGDNMPRPSEYDLFIPLGSLPLKFDSLPESIPFAPDYLPSALHKDQQLNLPRANEFVLRIGISMQYEDEERARLYRSIAMTMLTDWFKHEKIGFYVLEHNAQQQDKMMYQALAKRYGNIVLAPEYQESLTDQSRMIQQLDLVISIDNYFAALAAGTGIANWVLLEFVPDWHWGVASTFSNGKSPWFPETQLFRQKIMGDWSLPIRDISRGLSGLLEGQTVTDD